VRAAVVTELGRPPEVADRADPVAGDGEELVSVVAVPLNPVDVNVAAGRFYGGHPPLPFVPGCEGVGRAGGRHVWVFGSGVGLQRDGTLAELVVAPAEALVPVPDNVDPTWAAGVGIAGMAGWLPLAWRARVHPGETVVVLGATGNVGIVAVQAAKLLGAGRVVAVGRNRARLERAAQLGADATVVIDDGFEQALKEACGGAANLIVDPLWGEPLAQALEAAAPSARVVHVGQSAGGEATLASSVVRGKQLEILGYSNFAIPRDLLAQEYARLIGHAAAGELQIEVEHVALEGIGDAWQRQAEGPGTKLVVVP
jgi:NADPH2:quinone reductase